MINRYYFTDRALQVGHNNTKDNNHITHSISKTKIEPKFKELGIKTRYIIKILKVMATNNGGILNPL